MSTKLKKTLKIISIICVIILIIQGIFIFFVLRNRSDDILSFDSINSFIPANDHFVAVGSNNINDQGLERAKITKYNQNKEKVWETIFNNGYNSAFFDVAQDGDSFVAVGSFEANSEEHEYSIRSALLVRYDMNGRMIFSESFQILGDSRFNRVKVLETGYLVIGQSIFENMTLGFSDEGGGVIVKYDREGNILWQNNFGGSKSGLFNDFIIVDDIIYVVGRDAARVGIIVKFDMEGNRIGSTIYQYADTLGFTGIISHQGYLYIVGAKTEILDEDKHQINALIVKYDKELSFISETIYAGEGNERFNRIIVDDIKTL